MNKDLFRYKLNFITFCLLFGYAFAHSYLTGVYIDSQLEPLMNGTARLPFGQRLLIPLMAHKVHNLIPINVSDIFFLLEWVFTVLFYNSLKMVLETSFEPKKALGLSWLFILLLPLITIINYRYSVGGNATFFYPYDTPTLFFIALGFWCCLLQRWSWFYPLLFFATLNRESSILLVLLIPALYWQERRRVIRPFIIALAVYTVTRLFVVWMTSDLGGSRVEWFNAKGHFSYFSINLDWLFDLQYFPVFIFCMAGIPLLWFAFYDFIPIRFRPLRYITLAYFLGLLVVGMFMEARIFEEIIVLLYLPVCIAIQRWISGEQPFISESTGILYYLDRYAIVGMLLIIILLRVPLSQLLLWFLGWV